MVVGDVHRALKAAQYDLVDHRLATVVAAGTCEMFSYSSGTPVSIPSWAALLQVGTKSEGWSDQKVGLGRS